MKPKINLSSSDIENMSPMDRCQTPPYALAPLIPYLKKDWLIWESACGDGLLVYELKRQGFQVGGTDILSGHNFFNVRLKDFGCIVTNPPYSIKFQWLAQCYWLGQPFALLLPVETLGAQKAQTLFKQFGMELILLNRRVHFKMPHIGWVGSSAQFPVAWFTWQLNIGNELTYAELNY